MAYVSNTSINMLNLHYAVHALASGMGGIFYAVFLLRAGVPVALVLAAIAALLAGRFALRPLVLPLAKRWGLRPLVMVGCFIKALQFPILAHVHGPDLTLLLLIGVSAVGEVLYGPHIMPTSLRSVTCPAAPGKPAHARLSLP